MQKSQQLCIRRGPHLEWYITEPKSAAPLVIVKYSGNGGRVKAESLARKITVLPRIESAIAQIHDYLSDMGGSAESISLMIEQIHQDIQTLNSQSTDL